MIDLVLGGKSNALSISRALGTDNITSYLVDNHIQPIAASSKYVNNTFYCDNNINTFLKIMRDSFGDTLKVLYPTSDYWLEFITDNKYALKSNGFLFFDNSTELINTFTNKLFFYQKLSQQFPIPKTIDFNGTINGDYIVKPKKSFQQNFCIDKGFTQHEKGDIPDDYLIKQAFIDVQLEQHYSVSGIAERGCVKAAIITRKELEYPSPGGTATMALSVKDKHVRKQLISLAEKVLIVTGYSGAFEVEILKENDQFWLLEVNARFWLQHIMPLSEGVNFSIIYRKLLLGQTVKANVPRYYNENKRLLWLHEGSPISFFKANFAKKLDIMKVLFFQRSVISFGYFFKGDIKPLIEFIKCCLSKK
jgi:predicted ATP-grasp superfamily ATP-dependent carboligase